MNEQQLRRLSDCEVLVSKYHDKLDQLILQNTNYNKQIISKDEFQKLWDDFNARVSRDLGMIRKEMQAVNEENKTLLDKAKKFEHDLMTLHMQHHDKLIKHLDRIEKLDTELDNLHMQHGTHESHIKNIKDRIGECEKISPDLKEFKQNTLNIIRKLNEMHDIQRNRIDQMSDRLQNSQSENIILQKNIQDHKENSEIKYNDLKFIIKANLDAMLDGFYKINNKFDEKLKNLPQPVIQEQQQNNPLELVMFKNEIMQLVNPLKIDVSNSKEKSDINEMQLKIMDKKLENIYLLLKKHELTQ
jgi:hypothetical protein